MPKSKNNVSKYHDSTVANETLVTQQSTSNGIDPWQELRQTMPILVLGTRYAFMSVTGNKKTTARKLHSANLEEVINTSLSFPHS